MLQAQLHDERIDNRFKGRAEVEDDPYCRGYWDRVLFSKNLELHEHPAYRREYLDGYREAEMELFAESLIPASED